MQDKGFQSAHSAGSIGGTVGKNNRGGMKRRLCEGLSGINSKREIAERCYGLTDKVNS